MYEQADADQSVSSDSPRESRLCASVQSAAVTVSGGACRCRVRFDFEVPMERDRNRVVDLTKSNLVDRFGLGSCVLVFRLQIRRPFSSVVSATRRSASRCSSVK